MHWGQQGWYLDGSVQVGFLPAVVQQACDGDAVRQVVDEGDVVDEVVRLSDAEYYDSGGALKKHTARQDNYWTFATDTEGKSVSSPTAKGFLN